MDNDGAASALALGVAMAVFLVALTAILLTVRDDAPSPSIQEGPPISAERLSEIFLGRSSSTYYEEDANGDGQDDDRMPLDLTAAGSIKLDPVLWVDWDAGTLHGDGSGSDPDGSDDEFQYCEIAALLDFPARDCQDGTCTTVTTTTTVTSTTTTSMHPNQADPDCVSGIHGFRVVIVDGDDDQTKLLEFGPAAISGADVRATFNPIEGADGPGRLTVWSW